MTSQRLFHCVPADLGPELRGEQFAPPSLASEGFVDLSFAHQLAGTLQLHFAGQERVLLLELDPERVADELRLEASRNAEDFPHLYRALRPTDLLGA